MRSIIYTYYYGGNTKNIIALGNSIRYFSNIKNVCIVTPDVDMVERKHILRSFSRVDVSQEPLVDIVSDESVDRIMIISPTTIIQEKIDILLSLQVPGGSPNMSIVILRPNRLIPKIGTMTRDINSVRSFFIENGYTWNTLSAVYDNRPSTNIVQLMYENKYIPMRGDLITTLKNLLGDILGTKGIEAIEREEGTYILAFTHKSVNPVSNYETLEAYGDGFLKGAYMWVLSSIPGVSNQDQITKIADYYGGRDILSDIAEKMGLTKYIMTDYGPDTKMKSDIIESLIAAIAFSWDRLYDAGTDGVRAFVSHIYSSYNVDVEHYKRVYTSPIQLVNQYVQSLRLDRDKVGKDIDRSDPTKIIYKYLYNGEIVGVGIVPKTKGNVQDLIKLAKVKAAEQILNKKTLDKFVRI